MLENMGLPDFRILDQAGELAALTASSDLKTGTK
jgi:hypothetical protein